MGKAGFFPVRPLTSPQEANDEYNYQHDDNYLEAQKTWLWLTRICVANLQEPRKGLSQMG